MFIACLASNETSSIGAKCLFLVLGYIPLLKELVGFRVAGNYKHSALTGFGH
jgi:hypothetical protein